MESSHQLLATVCWLARQIGPTASKRVDQRVKVYLDTLAATGMLQLTQEVCQPPRPISRISLLNTMTSQDTFQVTGTRAVDAARGRRL